jgi:hypothetical protein
MQCTVNSFYEERKFNKLAIFRLITHYKSSYKIKKKLVSNLRFIMHKFLGVPQKQQWNYKHQFQRTGGF